MRTLDASVLPRKSVAVSEAEAISDDVSCRKMPMFYATANQGRPRKGVRYRRCARARVVRGRWRDGGGETHSAPLEADEHQRPRKVVAVQLLGIGGHEACGWTK